MLLLFVQPLSPSAQARIWEKKKRATVTHAHVVRDPRVLADTGEIHSGDRLNRSTQFQILGRSVPAQELLAPLTHYMTARYELPSLPVLCRAM